MTDSSDESSDHIEHLHQEDMEKCDHTKAYYRVVVHTNVDQGHQIDAEMETSTGVTGKDTTEIGVAGEAGLSGPLSKAVAKITAKKQWTTEFTRSKSDIDRESDFFTQSLSFEYELVDPNKADLTDPNIISGCDTTLDDGNDCPSHIRKVRKNHVDDISDAFGGMRDDMHKLADSAGFLEAESPKSPENSTISHYLGKAKDSVGTAVNKARSGASSAATRVSGGVSSAVNTVKQRFGSDDQDPNQNSDVVLTAESPEQDNTVAPTDKTHAQEATLHVSPTEDNEIDTAFSNGAVDLALANGEAANEGTTIHVSLDDDIPDVSPGDNGSVTVGLGGTAGTTMQISPGANDEADRSFGDGNIQLSFDDGEVHVSPGDDDIQMETGDDGDIQMAVGDETITSEPSNDTENEHDTPVTEQDSSQSTNGTRENESGSRTNGNGSISEADIDLGDTDPPEHADQWMTELVQQSSAERENGHDRDTDEETDPERDDDSPPRGGGPAGIT